MSATAASSGLDRRQARRAFRSAFSQTSPSALAPTPRAAPLMVWTTARQSGVARVQPLRPGRQPAGGTAPAPRARSIRRRRGSLPDSRSPRTARRFPRLNRAALRTSPPAPGDFAHLADPSPFWHELLAPLQKFECAGDGRRAPAGGAKSNIRLPQSANCFRICSSCAMKGVRLKPPPPNAFGPGRVHSSVGRAADS